MVFLGVLIYLFLFWFTPSGSIFLLAILFGALLSLSLSQLAEVYTSALLTGFLGSFLSGLLLNASNYNYFLQTAPPRVNQDVPLMLYTTSLPKIFAYGLFRSVIFPTSFWNHMAVAILAAVIFGIASVLVFEGRARRFFSKESLAGVILATIVLIFLWSGFVGSSPVRTAVSTPPQPESFAYDAIVNVKLFYYLSAGESYYDIYTATWAEDSRHDMNTISSVFYFREPLPYYLWKYTAFGNAANVFLLSLLLGALLLATSYFGMRSVLPPRLAILTPIALLPYLISGTVWVNIFFPDWWALLFGAIGFFLFLRKYYLWSSIFILLAAASRELIYPLLFAGLIASLWIRNRSQRRVAIGAFSVANLLFLAFYALHIFIASQHMPPANASDILGRFTFTNFGEGAFVTANYLMFGYGFFKLPGIVLVLIGTSGAYFLRETSQKIFALLFLFSILAFMAVSAISQYWGQLYLPMAIALLPLLTRLASSKKVPKSS